MAVHIRLARHGSKKHAAYRIVVTDQRNARDGRFIENIGTFDPNAKAAEGSRAPGVLVLDRGRLEYWTQQGARPSHTLERLLKSDKPAA